MISDDELRLTLQRLYDKIVPEGKLILRTTVPSRRRVPWLRRIEEWRLKALHLTSHFRSSEEVVALLSEAGFMVELKEPTAVGPRKKHGLSAGALYRSMGAMLIILIISLHEFTFLFGRKTWTGEYFIYGPSGAATLSF